MLTVESSGACQDSDLSTAQLIDQVIQVYEEFDEELSKDPNQRRFKNYAEVQDTSNAICAELKKRRLAAFPEVSAAIQNISISVKARCALIRSLREVSGERVDRFLLQLALRETNPEIYRTVFDLLAWRAESGGGLTIELSKSQIAHFTERITHGELSDAWDAARDLGNFDNVPLATRMQPIVERFRKEITDPSPSKEHPMFESGDYHDWVLDMFLRLFREIGPTSRPFLRDGLGASDGGQDIQKWLALALAATGDPDVAAQIKRVIDDPRESLELRSAAVECYVDSAGLVAIPDLERWAEDKSVAITRLHEQSTTPLAEAAALQLRLLRKNSRK